MEETLNIRPYAKNITDLSHVAWELEDPFHNGGNFQLIPLPNDDWLCYMRIFGYFITGKGLYCQTPQTKLKNPHLHRFCILDKDFNVKQKIPNIQSTFFQHPHFKDRFPYLEDGRISIWNNKLYITSTVVYQTEKGWAALGLELQRLDFVNGGIVAAHQWNSLQNGIGGLQKNWMPIPDKPFKYISATYKNGAQMIDIQTNKFTEGGFTAGELYRGNTPLVRTDCGYAAITHTVDMTTKVKTYRNYLVVYNQDLSVKWISRPFKLTETEIEFVTTLLVNEDEVLIGVTANDDTPEVLRFNKAEFLELVNIS